MVQRETEILTESEELAGEVVKERDDLLLQVSTSSHQSSQHVVHPSLN